jgi:hypothetical protein
LKIKTICPKKQRYNINDCCKSYSKRSFSTKKFKGDFDENERSVLFFKSAQLKKTIKIENQSLI